MEPSFWERHAKKIIVGALILVALILVYNAAYAAGSSVTISWTHPTSYTDGSALAATEIKETVITWRRPGNATVVGTARVAAPATSTVVTGLSCGGFNFTAVTVVKTNNVESAEAGPVLYATGVQCAPNPPTGLKVE
jgi:hypothetical protein